MADTIAYANVVRRHYSTVTNAKAEMVGADYNQQWNYIENIVGTFTDSESEVVKQNYQQFNDVRSQYYGRSDFSQGYPAATGIGMNTGGVVIDFIALHPAPGQIILPLSNPRQIDAQVRGG